MGARLPSRSLGGGTEPLGFAQAELPFDIWPRPHRSSMTPGLTLTLQPG